MTASGSVDMAEGPAAGLVILDAIAYHPQLASWPQIHVARGGLLARLGRHLEALGAYKTALELEPPPAQRPRSAYYREHKYGGRTQGSPTIRLRRLPDLAEKSDRFGRRSSRCQPRRRP